jgi:uncharacterized protein YcnI
MRSTRLFGLLHAAAATLMLAPVVAHAHATLEVQEAHAHSWYKARLNIPHGCAGSPTTAVRVQLPVDVMGVKPQPKPGWTLTIVRTKLDKPITGSHGETITERVSEIRWTGGKLLDEHLEEFVMQFRLPNRPGETVYFPTVQECEAGAHRWIEIPTGGKTRADYKEPAPHVTLLPAAARAH